MFMNVFSSVLSTSPRFRLDPAARLGAFDGGIQQLLHPCAIAKVWHHRLSVCHRTHELTDHKPLFAKHVLPGFDHTLAAGGVPKTTRDDQLSARAVPLPVPRNGLPEIPVHCLAEPGRGPRKSPFMDLGRALPPLLA